MDSVRELALMELIESRTAMLEKSREQRRRPSRMHWYAFSSNRDPI
jgi:hypothetical protein